MDLRKYEPELAAGYNRTAAQYRRDDEVELESENHQRLGGNLQRICRAFPRPVRVLEIGCGTGRYFHWLDNVKLLVGTDISAEMLRQAEHPVRAADVTAQEIRLMLGNVYEMDFEDESFDVIYCLGVFGYGAEVTTELIAKLHGWLAPGGRLYFNAIERPHYDSRWRKFRAELREAVYPRLPRSWQVRVDQRQKGVPLVRHTRPQLERVMAAAGFSDFMLSSNICHSPLWQGVHLECHATKGSTLPNGIDGEAFEFAETGLLAARSAAKT